MIQWLRSRISYEVHSTPIDVMLMLMLMLTENAVESDCARDGA